ncbi:MAG: hypothetical protein GYB58_14515 [Gammaproteobacteria bacterium]|nr:hypothetical protein [Gammaproteobacteria bacterium]
MKKFLFYSLLPFFIVGCATPYKSNGMGGGYDDWKLGEGLYRVAFYGNGHSTEQQVNDYWHRRSSELCNGDYEVLELHKAVNPIGISGELSPSLSVYQEAEIPIQTGKIQCL